MKLFNKQPLDYSLAKQDKYDVVNDDVDDDDPATFRRQSRRWRRLRVNICLFYLTLRSGSGLVGSWWANAPWLQILFEFCWRNFNWQFKNSFFNQQRLDSLSWEAVKVKQQRAQKHWLNSGLIVHKPKAVLSLGLIFTQSLGLLWEPGWAWS